MDAYAPPGPPGERGGDGCRARAGATRRRRARAALPDAHLHLARRQDLNELRVDALGESLVVLEEGTDGCEVELVDVAHEQHAVWIPHGDAGDAMNFSSDLESGVDHGRGVEPHRDA